MCQFVALLDEARPRTPIAAVPTDVPPPPLVEPDTAHGPCVPVPLAKPCTPVPSARFDCPTMPMPKFVAVDVLKPTSAVPPGLAVWPCTPTLLPVVPELLP